MSKLYRRCFQATDFSELEEEIENTRQEVRDCPDRLQRRRLMYLADTQNLREEAFLASGADAKSLLDILGHAQASFTRNNRYPHHRRNAPKGCAAHLDRVTVRRYCGAIRAEVQSRG